MTKLLINSGTILGSVSQGIHAFKGIPYAEALDARSRWRNPVPRKSWQGTRDARSYGPAAVQFGEAKRPLFPSARVQYFDALSGGLVGYPQSNDCLLLNVWTPCPDPSAKLPVMFWIHGGGFGAGAANDYYDGSELARRDAVIVTIQYRLGPLGFLHGASLFDGGTCSDNRGFEDMLLALQWVQENINAFGGDSSRVTIFGESAGGFAVYQLIASPKARGLFQRAISLGSMPDSHAPVAEQHSFAREALAKVGVLPGNTKALESLTDAQLQSLHRAMASNIFGPQAKNYGSLGLTKTGYLGAASGTPFLPDPPLEVYAKGTPNSVDLMLGTCANDGGLFSHLLPFGRYASARLCLSKFGTMGRISDLKAADRHYQQNLPNASSGRRWEQIINDLFFRAPTLDAARAHATGNPGHTFHFQLDYACTIPGLGAIHAVDAALLFGTGTPARLLHNDEQTHWLSGHFRDAVVSFAREGRPTFHGMPKWLPFVSEGEATMVFDHTSRVVTNLDSELLKCWTTGAWKQGNKPVEGLDRTPSSHAD